MRKDLSVPWKANPGGSLAKFGKKFFSVLVIFAESVQAEENEKATALERDHV
ncbi:MAG: hypothetical protein LBB26_01135 [Puniceicoccales bacterium]|nr:hypothetical protein [Puniceicoccales bacterium]